MSKRKAVLCILLILGISFLSIMIPITVMMRLRTSQDLGINYLILPCCSHYLFLYVGYIKISIPDSPG